MRLIFHLTHQTANELFRQRALWIQWFAERRKDRLLLQGNPVFVFQNLIPEVQFREGSPDVAWFDGRCRCLLFLDDLMNEADQNVCNLFTKLSHHRDVSAAFVTQNLFCRNRFVHAEDKFEYSLPRSVHESSRSNQVSNLTRQMYPEKS